MTTYRDSMPGPLKRAWMKRLRSGDYQQGKFNLRHLDSWDGSTTEWCCIGVLCDLVNPNAWVFDDENEPIAWRVEDTGEAIDVGSIRNLGLVLGLRQDTLQTLSELNDGTWFARYERRTFDEIATWIRDHIRSEK